MDFEYSESRLVKTILYVYSMETFLPYTLNKSILTDDKESLNNLYPFRYCLKRILLITGNKKINIKEDGKTKYRGFSL